MFSSTCLGLGDDVINHGEKKKTSGKGKSLGVSAQQRPTLLNLSPSQAELWSLTRGISESDSTTDVPFSEFMNYTCART